METVEHSIIAELEEAVRSGSSEKRVSTLRRVTDLLLEDGQRLSEEQVKVFDDVLCVLADRIEKRAKAELSTRLAPVDYAPFKIIRRLARDDEIAVAGPVLTSSTRLTTDDLVKIARSKGQDHLFAISSRSTLPEVLTDVIVDRGEKRVIRKLATNAGARFSAAGYSTMVSRAEADDDLAESLGLRIDLPLNFLRDLLRRATDAVRAKLMAIAPPHLQEEIKRVLTEISATFSGKDPSAKDFGKAEQTVRALHGRGELNDAAVMSCAKAGKFDEVAAAIALLGSAPTEMVSRVLVGPRADLVLIACKASGLSWPAVEMVLRNRPTKEPIAEAVFAVAYKDFVKLSNETAQRTLRFWQVHNKIGK